MTRGIPLFIHDYFNLDLVFFCNSETLPAVLEGDWDFKARKCLLSEENIKYDRLDIMENEANVEVEI